MVHHRAVCICRISAAVAAVLDAKDKIKEANIFDKGKVVVLCSIFYCHQYTHGYYVWSFYHVHEFIKISYSLILDNAIIVALALVSSSLD